MINKLIISAPFGNYYNYDGVTSTIGTFTLNHRGGWLKRTWRIAKTLRYSRKLGWINKLGLPNPGINTVTEQMCQGKILSIHGFNKHEWNCLAMKAVNHYPIAVEFNLSCPNVKDDVVLGEVLSAMAVIRNASIEVIAKLPPIKWMDFVCPLHREGYRFYHLCNTMPTPRGGLSGKVLKQYSLWAVSEVRQAYCKHVKIIGGGGIICSEDVRDYIDAGADYVAIASVLINPLRNKRRLINDLLVTANSYPRIDHALS